MNIPYVKQYENGVLQNPIKGQLITEFPNRKARRKSMQKDRFRGNKKGVSLTVFPKMKYERIIQKVGDKTILHYIAK